MFSLKFVAGFVSGGVVAVVSPIAAHWFVRVWALIQQFISS